MGGKGSDRNSQKSNPDAQRAADQRLQRAIADYEELRSKPIKTKEDNKRLKKLKDNIKHFRGKASEQSELHSKQHKGPQEVEVQAQVIDRPSLSRAISDSSIASRDRTSFRAGRVGSYRKITPGSGDGLLRLGMSYAEVKDAIGTPRSTYPTADEFDPDINDSVFACYPSFGIDVELSTLLPTIPNDAKVKTIQYDGKHLFDNSGRALTRDAIQREYGSPTRVGKFKLQDRGTNMTWEYYDIGFQVEYVTESMRYDITEVCLFVPSSRSS